MVSVELEVIQKMPFSLFIANTFDFCLYQKYDFLKVTYMCIYLFLFAKSHGEVVVFATICAPKTTTSTTPACTIIFYVN
jgi:hypothetical protein